MFHVLECSEFGSVFHQIFLLSFISFFAVKFRRRHTKTRWNSKKTNKQIYTRIKLTRRSSQENQLQKWFFAWIIAISFRVHEIISRWLSIESAGIFWCFSEARLRPQQNQYLFTFFWRTRNRNINLSLCLIISLSVVRDHWRMLDHNRRKTWKGSKR